MSRPTDPTGQQTGRAGLRHNTVGHRQGHSAAAGIQYSVRYQCACLHNLMLTLTRLANVARGIVRRNFAETLVAYRDDMLVTKV